ncbi:hypothetical protein KM043_014482 [Ampulex compressa]|nr:hypothetical protein KM043_014482 [Ampulex compressa]
MFANLGNSTRIELLTKDNYDIWCIHAEALLIKNEGWDYVNGRKPRPKIIEGSEVSLEAARAWDVADQKARSDLILSIGSSPAKKTALLKKLTGHRMAEGAEIRKHINEFIEVTDKLGEMDIPIHKDLQSALLLSSLPDTYENFRCAIGSRDELPNIETLKIKILEEFETRKQKHEDEPGAMAIVQDRRTNEWRRDQNRQSKNIRQGRTVIKCFNCGKLGHNLMSLETSHASAEVKSKGNVRMKTCLNNNIKDLEFVDALYVPELRVNLASVAKITEKGNVVTFPKRDAVIKGNDGKIKAKAQRIGDLYYIMESAEHAKHVESAQGSTNLKLWHERLGHLNMRDLKYMTRTKKAVGIDIQGDETMPQCEKCIQGQRIKFLQSDNGREYCNAKFDEFMREEGIQRRLTVPYTPQQNGPTSKQAWDELATIHSSKGPVRKTVLYRQLYNLRKNPFESMSQYKNNFQEKVNLLEDAEIEIPQELRSIILLNSLPEDYENFCVAIKSRDQNPTVEFIKGKLLEEEARRQGSNAKDNNTTSALVTWKAHISNSSTHTHKKFKDEDFNGSKYGHPASRCRLKRKDGDKANCSKKNKRT